MKNDYVREYVVNVCAGVTEYAGLDVEGKRKVISAGIESVRALERKYKEPIESLVSIYDDVDEYVGQEIIKSIESLSGDLFSVVDDDGVYVGVVSEGIDALVDEYKNVTEVYSGVKDGREFVVVIASNEDVDVEADEDEKGEQVVSENLSLIAPGIGEVEDGKAESVGEQVGKEMGDIDLSVTRVSEE